MKDPFRNSPRRRRARRHVLMTALAVFGGLLFTIGFVWASQVMFSFPI